MAAEEAISTGVRALRSLRDCVGNFILFEQEVKETLNSIFEKHRTEQTVFLKFDFCEYKLVLLLKRRLPSGLRMCKDA